MSEVFSKNGVNVSVTGTTMMHIDISAILVSISFDGHIFQARLSYSHFSHNTEGLCGERDVAGLLPAPPATCPTPELPQ